MEGIVFELLNPGLIVNYAFPILAFRKNE